MPTRHSIFPFADYYYYYYYNNLTLLSSYCVPGTLLSASTTALGGGCYYHSHFTNGAQTGLKPNLLILRSRVSTTILWAVFSSVLGKKKND